MVENLVFKCFSSRFFDFVIKSRVDEFIFVAFVVKMMFFLLFSFSPMTFDVALRYVDVEVTGRATPEVGRVDEEKTN
jgi:hypothetical protein